MALRTTISKRFLSTSSPYGERSMSSWWRNVEPALKDPILGVTEAFFADPSPDKVNVGVSIHGLAARGVHYFHQPGPILQDVGFFLLPELGQERAFISETLFTFIFLSFSCGLSIRLFSRAKRSTQFLCGAGSWLF